MGTMSLQSEDEDQRVFRRTQKPIRPHQAEASDPGGRVRPESGQPEPVSDPAVP